ncbi:uncharacterized protein VTP21DRAFT_6344 [Calcarisporiella thermophila]|uniref:uncharacterized protein n=1 Tax=Calcarisporiella thermophila TaxID=911321 RepID=UPI0037434582
MTHTILLLQRTGSVQSRTWAEFETVGASIEHLIDLYEQHLTEQNPNLSHIQYSAEELTGYLERFKELAALVYDSKQKAYVPHDKGWLRERVVQQLLRDAQGGGQRHGGARGGRRR